MASYTNHGLTLLDIQKILYDPVMHYWFLYALFVIMVIYVGFYMRNISNWVFFLAGVVMYVFGEVTLIGNDSYILGQLGFFTVFFAFGTLLDFRGLKKLCRITTLHLVLIAAVTFSCFWLIFFLDSDFAYHQVLRPLTSSALVVCVFAISILLDRYKVMGFIRRWGNMSLEIYLTHVLFLAGARILITQFVEIDWILHTIIGVIAGLYGPIIMLMILDRMGIRYLFRLPTVRPKMESTEAPMLVETFVDDYPTPVK